MKLPLQNYFISQVVLLKGLVKNPKFWAILGMDVLCVIFAHFLSYYVRFESIVNEQYYVTIITLIPLLVIVKIPVFYIMGLYRGMWRYTSITDLSNIVKGVFLSSTIIITLLLFGNRFQGLSRSVFILDAVFTFLFIGAHRILIRYYYRTNLGSGTSNAEKKIAGKKKLLLVGAGDAAEKVLREMQTNKNLPYTVVGLVDDNPAKTGMKIHGVPVVGLVDELAEHAQRIQAQEILISIATVGGKKMKRIVQICQDSQLPFKVLPGLAEFIDGHVSLKSMREISYADLLGREEVTLEQEKIGSYLNQKIILITGAGGSIGSELCRQILRFFPKQMILFDAGEENLYSIQMELQHEYDYLDVIPVLGEVQDLSLLDMVFQHYKPSVVFHAAAYKHVPLVEKNPWQAVHNNVIAAQLLIETSILHDVERFVLVSTDKAVRPTNVMGASKRLTELLMIAYGKDTWDGKFCPARMHLQRAQDQLSPSEKDRSDHNTVFIAVRFGNVLGSSGSVIPLFKRQIEKGGPVTVTHPKITRYFMSIEEAAQLILQAGAMGLGGEIFILKMGEPIKIAQMARDLIKLAGREPDSEIEIKFTGLREGEKLFEELITEGEGIVETNHEKIMVLRGNGTSCAELYHGLEQLQQKSKAHDSHDIKDILQQLIPEYAPDHGVASI